MSTGLPQDEKIDHVTTKEWRALLRLHLSQRLEINAIESALTNARILTKEQIKEIRTQASDTAAAWSSQDGDDVLRVIRIHSLPDAKMLVPPVREDL
jgi:hypothetical protein